MEISNDDRIAELIKACSRHLLGHGRRDSARMLAELPANVEMDIYGDGGVVAELEREISDMLGTEAAAFFVSGTMAQQSALRVHTDRNGRRTVGFHPTCHVDLHEGRGYERLHRLTGRPIGSAESLLTLDDLDPVAESLGVLVIELPQREIGGQLPAWDDLVAQVELARSRGAAIHMDGARLWQCEAAFKRPLSEIAGLFDTTYVSFYKDLGGLPGCCLAGPEEIIEEAREWRQRHGGTLFGMWPNAASALVSLKLRLPKMGAYHDHAAALASGLVGLDGLRIKPMPPQTSMFHLLMEIGEDQFLERVLDIAGSDGIWSWRRSYPTDHPDWRVVEITVGDATLDFEPAEFRTLIERILHP